MADQSVTVLGAGLAGCEAAWQLARRGIPVILYEMKPVRFSPAHHREDFAELICSNSLKAARLDSAAGLLKEEMRRFGSLLVSCAQKSRVPAGGALAVDREEFSRLATQAIESEPLIQVRREEVTELPQGPVIVATGPLTSQALSEKIQALCGGSLSFFDAAAPIVTRESLEMDRCFAASRYDKGEGDDYLNCPMNKEEYEAFYNALLEAQKVGAREFEKEKHFEGCMPVEALAERGPRTLTFGPLKPVGFVDPRTGRRPWAILQLRAETLNGETCNLVGCQTKLTYGEQARVFRMVPGLEKAEFARFGSMHRNTYVNAPVALNEDLSLKARPRVFLAGQITGVEGYLESAACGMWLGMLLAARAQGRELALPPLECALGALLNHLRTPVKHFQPSNAHFGLMPELDEKAKKKDRKALYSARARERFAAWRAEQGL